MPDNKRATIGRIGEDLAVKFLKSRGFKIIGRNLRLGHKEIDVIATHKNVLVFVEVKTRTSNAYGDGSEALIGQKTTFLARAAELFLYHNKWTEDIRFDLVLVLIEDGKKNAKIKHIQNIV